MMKLLVAFLCVFASLPAFAGEFEDSVCKISNFYYDEIWYALTTLAGSFALMMAYMDKFAFSKLNNLAQPVNKLKFRYEMWIPIMRFSLFLFVVTIIYQLTLANTAIGIITCILFLALSLYLSLITKFTLILNPLLELKHAQDYKKPEINAGKIFIQHIIFSLILYIAIAAVFYIIQWSNTQYNCGI